MPSFDSVEAPQVVPAASGTVSHPYKSESRGGVERMIQEQYPLATGISIAHDDVIEGARMVVRHFFPAWPADLACTQFTHGITNKLVMCRRNDTGESALVRIYGRNSEVLIDRGQEVVNLFTLARAGFAPPLYGRFQNGIVYGFTEGRPFSVADMSDPSLNRLVAHRLATWHAVPIPGERVPSLFVTLRSWLSQVPDTYPDAARTAYLRSHLSLDQVRADLDSLQTQLEALRAPIVFGHNDLLSGNVIYDSSREQVSFIDFEYANYTYRGFDIANHFCEYAGFDCDYSKFPSKQAQLPWLAAYIESAKECSPGPYSTTPEELFEEVRRFVPAAHFFWAVWALVQAKISDIDFDYLEYAVMRYNECKRTRVSDN